MPVPLPTDDEVIHGPPDAAEAQALASAIAYIVAPPSGLTHLQHLLIEAMFNALTGQRVDTANAAPATPAEFAAIMRLRTLIARERIVQVMLLAALILRPMPRDVTERIKEAATELGVDDGMIGVAEDFASDSYDLAARDFDRNGYTENWHADDVTALHTATGLDAPWDDDDNDPELAARWAALADLPEGTVGRSVWELYEARGFVFPGLPNSAPPLLAQHDWVHVIADYGTTVENELEVFAFIARANDDMHAFSLLAMVVSLFETGSLARGAGLFEASPGHMSTNEGVAIRVADAMRRGALTKESGKTDDSVDFMRVDWFSLAERTVDDVRAYFGVVPKSDDALHAGSVGPWEPGGISPFQRGSGEKAAAADGRAYDAYGATPSA